MTKIKRYSPAFKRRVIDDMKAGRFSSISACARYFGISKYETIVKWLRSEGLMHLLPTVKIVDLETE